VTGIDQSPEFLAAAQRLAAADGVGDRVEFLVGDVHELDFPRRASTPPWPTRS
jgi:ubiquinone/menaquinone biosynthesis C-methylase UbiE